MCLLSRGEHDVLTVQKFSRYPLLVQLLGDGDLIDAFVAFKREFGRLQRGNKYEVAVTYSIGADHKLLSTGYGQPPMPWRLASRRIKELLDIGATVAWRR